MVETSQPSSIQEPLLSIMQNFIFPRHRIRFFSVTSSACRRALVAVVSSSQFLAALLRGKRAATQLFRLPVNSRQGQSMAGKNGTSNRRGRPPASPRSRGRARRGRSSDQISYGHVDSSDQVSSVSATIMIEELETQEEEILSMDMGQGSLHEIDETLAPEENGLQIVPWEIRDEIDSICKEKGAFIVSLLTCKREESLVIDEIKATWGPLWNEINDEFECELKKKPKFQDLVNHMFYVWEGNHRTVAWTETLKERFSTSKEKHCRVLCTIIDPTKVHEIALLSSLQRMNFMNTHALVATHLRDEIVNTTHICAADHVMYLNGLPEKDQNLIAAVRKKYAKGSEPWYPLTRSYLGIIVYDIQMTKEKESYWEVT
ncbi:hypothetical protein GOP47_0019528 [Adiantum capillus-veneris]|uniref:Uncharacterized protein n=1 Tax=Adiantum capillus-veneris TaxID=13818 RepID=A0A9D4UC69_ADICA|nr:hypothetical protein GOP47_0019528 [Adiantum capillus-veneris]